MISIRLEFKNITDGDVLAIHEQARFAALFIFNMFDSVPKKRPRKFTILTDKRDYFMQSTNKSVMVPWERVNARNKKKSQLFSVTHNE